MCERTGWPDNPSFQNLVAWTWARGGDFYLIVVNLSTSAAQGNVRVANDELRGKQWCLTDARTGSIYTRSGDDMLSPGLYVDLQPWSYHFFRFAEAAAGRRESAASAG